MERAFSFEPKHVETQHRNIAHSNVFVLKAPFSSHCFLLGFGWLWHFDNFLLTRHILWRHCRAAADLSIEELLWEVFVCRCAVNNVACCYLQQGQDLHSGSSSIFSLMFFTWPHESAVQNKCRNNPVDTCECFQPNWLPVQSKVDVTVHTTCTQAKCRPELDLTNPGHKWQHPRNTILLIELLKYPDFQSLLSYIFTLRHLSRTNDKS